MYAAENGHIEVVKILLEHGANIEANDYEGELYSLIWRKKNATDKRRFLRHVFNN